jgi:hypothetical protein
VAIAETNLMTSGGASCRRYNRARLRPESAPA